MRGETAYSSVVVRAGGRPSIPEAAVIEPKGRSVLGRPVKPGDDSGGWGGRFARNDGATSSFVIARQTGRPNGRPMTGSGGRPSIPEAAVIEPRGRSLLDTPHARSTTTSSGSDVRANEAKASAYSP